MKKLFAREIEKAVGGTLKARGHVPTDTLSVSGASTDSRVLNADEVFFALTSGDEDGHRFISDAAKKGAALFVISDESALDEGFKGAFILVEDTLRAYQDLAAYYRGVVDPVIVAVTGSVGKTTLKDMVAHIAGTVYTTSYTEGNFNNQIGVPKTILAMPEDTEILVLEMGMSAPGEIKRLADIARPEIGVITNVGLSHREFFDSDDGILKEKMDIAAFFGEDNILVVGGDDRDTVAFAGEMADNAGFRLITVATGHSDAAYGDYQVRPPHYDADGRISFTVENEEETERFILATPGGHVPLSVGLAAAASACIDIELNAAALALRDMKSAAHRMQPIQSGAGLIIDDTYNASPASMKNGLAYLAEVAGGRRSIAVLADMNELGDRSPDLHSEIGRFAAGLGVDLVVTYGSKAISIADGAEQTPGGTKAMRFTDKTGLIKYLRETRKENDVIFVKGSNSLKMYEVVRALLQG
ncbi:MAG: UDP-N-acetylmuramoyl-tripeptide--D-alanyl-D-alanine ligase [Clostridiales Family XIII bacterium]|jgi:UDP-N-acetylmuramoyl-tripeptide--D-alanyl-D-alanine ligase|nr:UDP-N-acetylmuramoyl-tripeptide--D-alanyl-D-alanine ligase [Clostridiales Family XIII bacterium]